MEYSYAPLAISWSGPKSRADAEADLRVPQGDLGDEVAAEASELAVT